MSVVSFCAGFAFGFWWGWLLSLVLLGTFPFMMIMAGGLNSAMESGLVEQMKAYSQSAGYAE